MNAMLCGAVVLHVSLLEMRANASLEKPKEELKSRNTVVKDDTFRTSDSPNLRSQATVYAKLAESDAVKTGSLKSSAEQENLKR
ncbi:unnamed protein product [Prunus armeniaca]|uniref:Uncharacterized protein n=1 Tax=Prunus armeniaca TaxID=36596 RepID=A0A6J5TXR7_PRUAR|nr:unnamed protein product [Prunus armeniaca]